VTRTPDPASSALAPVVPRREPPPEGGPGPVPPAGPGGKTPQRRERAAAGMPPAGEADPAASCCLPASPVRGPRTPAGTGLPVPREVADPAPAGSTGLRGKDFTAAAKAEQSRQARAKRTGRGRYTRVADRTAGTQYKPGMAVRKPQKPPDGAA
jgi:hypothetical protein